MMKKTNLLFVMPSLAAGGGERSLINLLSLIDYDRYAVDLFLFKQEGLFMEFLPKQVRVLPLPNSYRIFTLPILTSLWKLLLRGKFVLIASRIRFTINRLLHRNISVTEQYNWKHLARSLQSLDGDYDAAIGFLEKTSTYFCIDKVTAAKKIGWMHNDYDNLGMDPGFDIVYFDKLDHIMTVSEECAQIFKRRFANQHYDVEVMYNIVSPTLIRRMAMHGPTDLFQRRGSETIIVSVGRLHVQKCFELAIVACHLLVNRGHALRWYIIGEGEERKKLTDLIEKHRLQEQFILLGLRANPYPYIQQSDIFVQTSRFEGKSIAIDEAKILQKPIVITNFPTAKDQIEDGQDGCIVDMNAEAIADGIERLIKDVPLRERFIRELSGKRLGTEAEIDKLYGLVGVG